MHSNGAWSVTTTSISGLGTVTGGSLGGSVVRVPISPYLINLSYVEVRPSSVSGACPSRHPSDGDINSILMWSAGRERRVRERKRKGMIDDGREGGMERERGIGSKGG